MLASPRCHPERSRQLSIVGGVEPDPREGGHFASIPNLINLREMPPKFAFGEFPPFCLKRLAGSQREQDIFFSLKSNRIFISAINKQDYDFLYLTLTAR